MYVLVQFEMANYRKVPLSRLVQVMPLELLVCMLRAPGSGEHDRLMSVNGVCDPPTAVALQFTQLGWPIGVQRKNG